MPIHAHAAAGWIDDALRQFPAELFGNLVAHRLFAFDAEGLLEGRDIEPSLLRRAFGNHAGAVADQAIDQSDVRAVKLHEIGLGSDEDFRKGMQQIDEAEKEDLKGFPPDHDRGKHENSAKDENAKGAAHHENAVYSYNQDAKTKEEIEAVQRTLQKAGLYHGEIDGKWGPKTNGAFQSLMEWAQKGTGREINGAYDPDALKKMADSGKLPKDVANTIGKLESAGKLDNLYKGPRDDIVAAAKVVPDFKLADTVASAPASAARNSAKPGV